MRNTPENIAELGENEIFIFGSNLAGLHGGGAAKIAHEKFGAEWGAGEGLTGKCYAFPTLDESYQVRTTEELKESIKKLEKFARENKDKTFFLTRVGCGIAGYSEAYISSGFVDMPQNVIRPKGW